MAERAPNRKSATLYKLFARAIDAVAGRLN